MASVAQPRLPFASLDAGRLQTLQSVKNRQNAIPITQSLSSPSKPTCNTPVKRRFESVDIFDDFDSENVDPSLFLSPTKKGKGLDGFIIDKPAKFTLIDAKPVVFNSAPSSLSITPPTAPVNASLKNPALSLSVPSKPASTISSSRGSPKHKRVGLLSSKLSGDAKRRFSSSPFRRVEPPSSSKSSALPFSIDAALSGTIASYEPALPVAESKTVTKPMPSTWFFDIHEDTADEEAANMMEHHASCLDLSSDDDSDTKRRRDLEDRGKENVPPPDFVAPVRAPRSGNAVVTAETEASVHRGISNKTKALSKAADVMQEDRSALQTLAAEDFYPDGLTETSVEVTEVLEDKENNLGNAQSVVVSASEQLSTCAESLKRSREDED